MRNSIIAGRSLALVVLCLANTATFAQTTNEITSVSPNSAGQGTTNLVVTFNLDTDAPPAPPAGVLPDSVTIGSLGGTSVTHDSQYVVTAVFSIPPGEPAGSKDAAVSFTTPNGSLVFSLVGGFTVTAVSDIPPSIIQHPQSLTVAPDGFASFSVVASGTEPLDYQWQKNGTDISGATASDYVINPVALADAGMYGCVVTNDFGSATSNTATLTVTQLPYDIYPIVDTGQTTCYNNTSVIACPNPGAAFHGQDAQYAGNAPSFTLSGDGLTVLDNITGLTWQRSPDTDGDNDIDASDKLTWTQAQAYPATLNAVSFGGFDDWRLPTIKELYSLIDFRGVDPSGCDDFATCPNIVPFIDTNYFDFAYGDTAAGERIIDSQYASSTLYVSTVDDELLFGVNFADGRIKGYGLVIAGTDKTFLVMCVRGPSTYGTNNFVDNGNGTVTDRSTGLMWTQGDSGVGYNWQAALGYAENLNFAGYTDWRLPSVKELQGILDYTRSPDTTSSAAIDPIFDATPIVNEEGQADWPYYWANTTHANWMGGGESGAYVAFGRGLGYLDGQWQDVHGAGCQRSDFKDGDPADYPFGHGPQGDAIRIFNYVRAVRDTVLSECFGDGDCDDENVCTDDTCLDGTCQHADNTGPCDDGLFCTLTDVCLSGSCTGSGDPCPGQTCDEDSDTCIAPSVPAASQCGLISMLMMVLLGGTMVFMRFGREALGGAGD